LSFANHGDKFEPDVGRPIPAAPDLFQVRLGLLESASAGRIARPTMPFKPVTQNCASRLDFVHEMDDPPMAELQSRSSGDLDKWHKLLHADYPNRRALVRNQL
jgi:hypothetical protein